MTYGNLPVNDSAIIYFNITLSNETHSYPISVISSAYSNLTGLWTLNFSAPNLSIGKGYDITVNATYVNISLSRTDRENKAIIYEDPYYPLVTVIVPSRVPANSTVDILVNATDSGGIGNVTKIMIYPANTTEP